MRISPILLLAVVLTLLAGCAARPDQTPYIRLSELDPTLAAGAQSISPRPVLRVGLSSMLSPQEALLQYGPLFDHLGRSLQRHVEIVLPRSYTEAVDLVRSGGVELAIVNSYAYVSGSRDFGMEALAAPVYGGTPTYRSFVLVRQYSGLQQFSDLKGHTFAYTDPISSTGRLYPEALIRELNEPVDRFFDHTIFTTSHDKAINALDQGLVDGTAVSDRVYYQMLREDPDLKRRLRIIAQSEPFATAPFVVNPRLGYELKRAIQGALLTMHESPEGREVLQELGVDRYLAPAAYWYDSVRDLATSVGGRP